MNRGIVRTQCPLKGSYIQTGEKILNRSDDQYFYEILDVHEEESLYLGWKQYIEHENSKQLFYENHPNQDFLQTTEYDEIEGSGWYKDFRQYRHE